MSPADYLPPILMVLIPIIYCVIDEMLDIRITKRKKKCRSTTNTDQKASKK